MAELTITKDNFKTEVLESDVPVLLDFWATWCGPCRKLAPILAEIASEYAGRVKVGKVNVDDEVELAAQFRIMSIPTVMLFKGGKAADGFMGYRPKADVAAFLNKNL